jgi:RNA polymerase sigma-70 factor (ECF subfamily)
MSYTIDKYYHRLIKNNHNIIKAIQQNDKRVIQELYYDNRDYFLNWAAKENHISFEDAKDLYQDAMVVLIQKIQDRKVERIFVSFRAYIFGLGRQLIRNKIKEEFKRDKREGIFSDRPLLLGENHTEDDRIGVVVSQLDSLPDPCRGILTHFYLKNLTYEEIAVSLQYKSINSLKVQKYRCLKYLKDRVFKNTVKHI